MKEHGLNFMVSRGSETVSILTSQTEKEAGGLAASLGYSQALPKFQSMLGVVPKKRSSRRPETRATAPAEGSPGEGAIQVQTLTRPQKASLRMTRLRTLGLIGDHQGVDLPVAEDPQAVEEAPQVVQDTPEEAHQEDQDTPAAEVPQGVQDTQVMEAQQDMEVKATWAKHII